ncbi:hypothetical protein J537_0906 [Acinetobacter baumannii 1437282]|nr:hypothetical protein J537_0906 [Acinetobacter baumannii 1437282]
MINNFAYIRNLSIKIITTIFFIKINNLGLSKCLKIEVNNALKMISQGIL